MALSYRGDFFKEHADQYDYLSDEDFSIVKESLPTFPSNGTLLDLGCGSGAVGTRFRLLFPQLTVIGTDICLPLLKWVGFQKCQSDASHLPFENDSFDGIVAAAALHHFPNIGAAIKECGRCLKTDGVFLAYDPNRLHPQRFIMMTNPLRHIFYKTGDHAISPVRLRRIMKKENFREVRIRYIAFEGKGGSLIADLNYKMVNQLIYRRLDRILKLVAPWFIITAVKA
jgi:tRNA (uracil-5-)-methyltransferase TRM9